MTTRLAAALPRPMFAALAAVAILCLPAASLAQSIDELRPRAEQGDAEAQMTLGFIYQEGREGQPQDYSEAAEWYRRAADQGYVSAQVLLGDLYVAGRGVSQDYAEAARWFRVATDQGHAAAPRRLASLYENGRGAPQDYAEAARLYRLSSDRGDKYAGFFLAEMYAQGRGVSQDDAEAARWYRVSAERGYEAAQVLLGTLYANGRGVPQDHAEAVRWYRAAADQGSDPVLVGEAQMMLGAAYAAGEGVARDSVTALEHFNAALGLAPGDQKILNALLAFLCRADRPSDEQAVILAACTTVIEGGLIDPQSLSNAFAIRGFWRGWDIFMRPEARADLERAIQLWPENVNALAFIGEWYRSEDPALGLPYLDKAVQIDPYNSFAWAARCENLLWQDRHQEAIESCDRALSLNPDSAWAGRNRTLAAGVVEGRRQAAENEARSARELDMVLGAFTGAVNAIAQQEAAYVAQQQYVPPSQQYAPPQYAPQQAIGGGQSSSQRAHNPANEAESCITLSLRPPPNPSGGQVFTNTCSRTVEMFWCRVDNGECGRSGRQWTIRGGGSYPVAPGEYRYAACYGANNGGFDAGSQGTSYSCD